MANFPNDGPDPEVYEQSVEPVSLVLSISKAGYSRHDSKSCFELFASDFFKRETTLTSAQ